MKEIRNLDLEVREWICGPRGWRGQGHLGFREKDAGLVSLGLESRPLIFWFSTLVPQLHPFTAGATCSVPVTGLGLPQASGTHQSENPGVALQVTTPLRLCTLPRILCLGPAPWAVPFSGLRRLTALGRPLPRTQSSASAQLSVRLPAPHCGNGPCSCEVLL